MPDVTYPSNPAKHAQDGTFTCLGHLEVTVTNTITGHSCRARDVLDRVGEKWSLLMISQLGDGPKRFTELKRGAYGISQRMLTVTLRSLERDGIVIRTVYAVVPPRVEYELTPRGHTLLETVRGLIGWAEAHADDIETSRAEYDRQAAAGL